MAYKPSIKTLWAIAKSQELQLTDEELHLLVSAHTGKDSIRDLSPREITMMIRVLDNMKSSSSGSGKHRKKKHGNACTENQRKKIYKLQEALGWDKPSRIRGMCRRMFGVDRVEWLSYQQCSKLIEALKKMAEREQERKDVAQG